MLTYKNKLNYLFYHKMDHTNKKKKKITSDRLELF